MDRSKFTPLEISVWAAEYSAELRKLCGIEQLAASHADAAVVRLRRQVLPPEQWGGE